MSVWGNHEIVKVDGEYKAYVKVQNDWSGVKYAKEHRGF